MEKILLIYIEKTYGEDSNQYYLAMECLSFQSFIEQNTNKFYYQIYVGKKPVTLRISLEELLTFIYNK